METAAPSLSVIIPTYNNLQILKDCLESWQSFAADEPIEILVIEDGCTDGTAEYLEELSRTEWGRRFLRWFHEDDVHELKCTNRGLAESQAMLVLAWQKDMLLQSRWLVRELISTFAEYPEIGMLSLSRGLNCLPLNEPITKWENLTDWRRLQSTIGKAPLNWFRLQEVDAVVRPWVIRKACLGKVGLLDEEFRLSEWDEADLCFRIRKAGWRIATHGYERVGAYVHYGSTTLSHTFTEEYKERVLRNGQLFHSRWTDTICAEYARDRHRWWRRTSAAGLAVTLKQMRRFVFGRRKSLRTR